MDKKSVPQMIVEISSAMAETMNRRFGDGAFGRWLDRMVSQGRLVLAWSDKDTAPAVHWMLDEELERTMFGLDAGDAADLDEDGTARGDRYSVRVLPADVAPPGVRVSLTAWIAAVPQTPRDEEGAPQTVGRRSEERRF